MHLLNCYLKKTKKIKLSKNQESNCIISLTTTPARINKIWPTINSLLLQTVLPTKIIIWLPKFYKRFNTSIEKLPDFLCNHSLIDVKWIDEDYGPATKLLPCLKANLDPDTKIVIVDDDIIYPKNLVATLIAASEKQPDSAITVIGSCVINNTRIKYQKKTSHQRTVDVLHGYGAYLVKPIFFTSAIFSYPENYPAVFTHDDVWISGHLKRNNISIVIPSFSRAIYLNKQNFLLANSKKNSKALCRNENSDPQTFIKAWEFFQK